MANQNLDPEFMKKVMSDIEASLEVAGVTETEVDKAVVQDMLLLQIKQLSIRFGSAYERIGRAYLRCLASQGTNNPDSVAGFAKAITDLERLGAELSFKSKQLPQPKLKG